MFLPFSRFKRSKERREAEGLVEEGLKLLGNGLTKQALFQFQEALGKNQEVVAEILKEETEKAMRRGDNEQAVSLGSIVLKIRRDDYELANRLGNSARKNKDYKKANAFYREAFRINRSYEIPLYNLAAGMGRIPRFNNDVKLLVDKFADVHDYILPNYKLQKDYIERIEQEIAGSDPNRKQHEPTYRQVCNHISKKISALNQEKTEKAIATAEKHLFNLGRYALAGNDAKFALKCLLRLKKRKSRLEYLDMLITLAMDLDSPSDKLTQHMMVLLSKDPINRYLNANLGIMFRKRGKRILSYKYLATAALLLEKTNGIFCRNDLIRLADDEMDLGNLKKALKIYKLVDSEINHPHVKKNIGQILIYKNRFAEALPLFKSLLEMDREDIEVRSKIREIHDYFLQKGEELCEANKHTSAVSFMEQALSAARLPETLKKTADLYKYLMNEAKAEQLFAEYRSIIQQSEDSNAEERRQILIEQGKDLLLKKDFEAAIDRFEKAFPMKIDKDVFVFLAHIYKILKRTRDLEDLMTRWKEMIRNQGINLDEI